jgi:3-hydroxyisobutyrate dehydrogenase-like beta-hydroxyacid dehydrogenase
MMGLKGAVARAEKRMRETTLAAPIVTTASRLVFEKLPMKHIAFLGIGLMGLPMAQRLLAVGFAVTAWNRTLSKAQPLETLGARIATSAADAVREADIILTMLENGVIVGDVLFAPEMAYRANALVIDMSSIKPKEAQDHAARLKAMGVRHIDAPVSGGTVGAQAGTLAIMAGGEAADIEEAMPIFAPMGKAMRVGPHGAGQLAKLANQMIVGITIGAVSEALQLAAKGGADPALVREAIKGGFASSRVLEVHGERMVKRDFAKRAAATVQLKDMNNALETAELLEGFQLPITSLTRNLFADLCSHGGADADHSGLYLELERLNKAAETLSWP